MLFANVIVKEARNPKSNFFTYSIPPEFENKIKAGFYLLLPWGIRQAKGVVISIEKQTTIPNPKPIKEIIFDNPVLKNFQIRLLKWLSYYYATSPTYCLNLFLPNFPARLESVNINDNNNLLVNQKLILIPDLNLITKAVAKFGKGSYIINHYKLSRTEKFKNWQKVYNGETETIIGTRSALFLPFSNLKEIRILSEHKQSYKEEQSPYYQSLKVAVALSKLTSAKIVIEDTTPSLSAFHLTSRKTDKLITLKHDITVKSKYLIIDLNNERKLENYRLISTPLANLLTYVYRNRLGPILLYLNRKSESGYIYCSTCKITSFAIQEPEFCPNCKAANIKFFSINLTKLANETKSLLGTNNFQFIQENKNEPVPTKPIVLSTSAIFSQPIIDKFALIGIISADTLLNLADFNSSEKTFYFIADLANFPLKKIDRLPQLVIQTNNPNLKLFKLASTNNWQVFYQQELKQRKTLNYPPFSIIAKLSITKKNSQQAAHLAEILYHKLKGIPQNKVEIEPPITSFGQLSKKSKWNIILKSKKRQDLDQILAQIPAQWTINIDPDTLL